MNQADRCRGEVFALHVHPSKVLEAGRSAVVRRPAYPLRPWSNGPSRNRVRTIQGEVASDADASSKTLDRCDEDILLKDQQQDL